MNAAELAALIFKALAAASAAAPVVEQAITDHWGKDHIAQAQHGATLLQSALANVAAVFDADPSKATPSPEMQAAAPAAQP